MKTFIRKCTNLLLQREPRRPIKQQMHTVKPTQMFKRQQTGKHSNAHAQEAECLIARPLAGD